MVYLLRGAIEIFVMWLWVEIKSRIWNKWEGLLLGICYVPPELSGRRENVEEIFEKIGSQIMEFRDLGRVILCGDFNARCGGMQEFAVEEYGSAVLRKREVIDTSKNQSGEFLWNLMRDHDLFMHNGRGNEGQNDFTCISKKGKSVVDFCISSVDDSDVVRDFEVVSMSSFSLAIGADVLTRESELKWSCQMYGCRGQKVQESLIQRLYGGVFHMGKGGIVH